MSFPKRKKVTRNLDWGEDRVLISDFICSLSEMAMKKNSFFSHFRTQRKNQSREKKKKNENPHFREVKAYSKINVKDILTPGIGFSIL